MRAAVFALLAAGVACDFTTFTPFLSLYASTSCNTTATVISGTASCTLVQVGAVQKYVKSSGCNFDNTVSGVSMCQDTACTINCVSLDSTGVIFDQCMTDGVIGYKASCSAEPCCQTSAIVVCFAVFLSLGAAGLCVFWAWTDRVHKAKLAADKKSLEDSIAAETAKAAQIAGGGISTVAGAASGYSAL